MHYPMMIGLVIENFIYFVLGSPYNQDFIYKEEQVLIKEIKKDKYFKGWVWCPPKIYHTLILCQISFYLKIIENLRTFAL